MLFELVTMTIIESWDHAEHLESSKLGPLNCYMTYLVNDVDLFDINADQPKILVCWTRDNDEESEKWISDQPSPNPIKLERRDFDVVLVENHGNLTVF